MQNWPRTFSLHLSDDFTKFVVNKVYRYNYTLTKLVNICVDFEQGFKRNNASKIAIVRKVVKKKARYSKRACFHCRNWKRKYKVGHAFIVERMTFGRGNFNHRQCFHSYLFNLDIDLGAS